MPCCAGQTSEMGCFEVVGVRMSLLPPNDTISPPSLSKIMEESLANLMSDDESSIPLNWNL